MKILFVCVENACRSQMAEGIFNYLAKNKHKAFSAGISIAKEVNPLAIEVLKEIGIDISRNKPKLIIPEVVKNMDKIISMGCIKGCPPVKIDQDWRIDDPKGGRIDKFRKVRKEIFEKVEKLIRGLEK